MLIVNKVEPGWNHFDGYTALQYARLRALLHRANVKRGSSAFSDTGHPGARADRQAAPARCAELHRGGEHRHGVYRRVAGNAAVLVVFKRPVEQVRVVVPVVRIRERHAHELRRAALRAGHERPARGLGVPGLDADRTVIAAQQAVVVHERLPSTFVLFVDTIARNVSFSRAAQASFAMSRAVE